jgi:hypothetical protein
MYIFLLKILVALVLRYRFEKVTYMVVGLGLAVEKNLNHKSFRMLVGRVFMSTGTRTILGEKLSKIILFSNEKKGSGDAE